MFGTIRRHQQWLWAVIITLTIISFVIFFSPYSKMNTDRRSGNYGSINGQSVSEAEYFNALRETELHTFFMTGRWPNEDKKRTEQETTRDVYQWLLLIQKENQLGIHPAGETLEQLARQLIQSLERLGVSSPAVFVEKVLPPRGYTVADFERFVRHYAGIQELIQTAGLSGKLVTPEEARVFYTLENEAVATTPVFFSASNYLATVTAPPDVLAQFYSNRLASYRIPERVQVSYVVFGASNFIAQAEVRLTNLAEVVEANFHRLGTNAPAVFPEAKTPEAVKAKIREEVLRREALQDARKKALEFGGVLETMEPRSAENLQALAASNHLSVEVSAPFGRDEPPKDIEAGAGFAKRAFELTAQDPFAGPIAGQEEIYEIALKQKLPSRIPTLEEIRDAVTADYKFSQALMQARLAALAFRESATNGLAHGKAFSAICAEAKVTPVTLPPISISTRTPPPELEELIGLDQIKHAAFSVAPGQVSNLYPTSDGSMVLYVKEKLPVDMAKMNSELPEFMRVLRQRRQQEAFNQWLGRESEWGLRDTPVFQQPPPTMQTAGKAKS